MPYLYNTVPGQRFRIEQWARIMTRFGVTFNFIPFESPQLKLILHLRGHYGRKIWELFCGLYRRLRILASVGDGWDLIFLHRELAPVGPPVLERFLARRRVPIVYDFDDAIFLPDVSEANERFKSLKWPQKTGTICHLSNHVIVGNRYLKEYAANYTTHVSIVPTTIDTDEYRPRDDVTIRGRPTIGWSGSITTVKHLRTIEPALRRLRSLLDFRLKVIGTPHFSISGLDVESKPWTADSEVEELKSFDIGIMPLPDDRWSRGKCGLKGLQYMALGVPTIMSPVGVNCEIIEDGRNGFLASGQDEWVAKLSALASDVHLRQRFTKEGRETVEASYSARVHAPHVLDIFERIRAASSNASAIRHRLS